jgi:hypothetical protein
MLKLLTRAVAWVDGLVSCVNRGLVTDYDLNYYYVSSTRGVSPCLQILFLSCEF